MKDPKTFFSFTAMPKCMISDRPTLSDVKFAKEKGRILFIIVKGAPPADPRQVDMFIDGYLAGCETERSEHMAIYFNDTDFNQEDAQLKFIEKYKWLRYPDVIDGYTTLATGKKGNLLSGFLGVPVKKELKAPNENAI